MTLHAPQLVCMHRNGFTNTQEAMLTQCQPEQAGATRNQMKYTQHSTAWLAVVVNTSQRQSTQPQSTLVNPSQHWSTPVNPTSVTVLPLCHMCPHTT